jgi:hypothetical protein
MISLVLFKHTRSIWIILPVLVWLLSLPWLLLNDTRPLVRLGGQDDSVWAAEGREAYFLRRMDLPPVYEEITSLISQSECSDIGIVFHENNYFFEYPFWMMLREKGYSGNIHHILVQNRSARYEDIQFSPCFILSSGELDHLPGYLQNAYPEYQGAKTDFFLYQENASE